MAKAPSPLVEHCLELFSPLGHVRAKSMFGGWGFYVDDLFFALIADETLYLKVDDKTEGTFREAGSWPFTYTTKDGRSVTMAYWSAPEEAMESPAMMADWARRGLGAALRARSPAGAAPFRAKAGGTRGRPASKAGTRTSGARVVKR